MDDDLLRERMRGWHEDAVTHAPAFEAVLGGTRRRRVRRGLLPAAVAVAVLLIGVLGRGGGPPPATVVGVDLEADPFAPSVMDDLLRPAMPAGER